MSWNNIKNQLLAVVVLSGAISATHAAPSKANIEIHADSVVLEQKTNSSRYTGNVILTQGNMDLSSDSLTAYTKKKRLSRIEAQGSPTVLNSISDNGQIIRGEADRITYLASNRMMILKGHAKLTQDGNTIDSDEIRYDLANGILKAGGSKPGSRVNVILLPPEE